MRPLPALERQDPGTRSPIRSTTTDRTAGAMLSGRGGKTPIRPCRPAGRHLSTVSLNGTAGQSFGAFLAKGVTLDLVGEANDYVGKGLSGGRIVVRPPDESAASCTEESIIVGNTVLYGAVSAEKCYFRGRCRRAFRGTQLRRHRRSSKAPGDHGCEYMTGGVVVVPR